MSERICSAEGCERKHVAQGFCQTHYVAARRTGEIQKLDQSGLHLLDNIDPVARTATCSVCGEVPAWSRGSRWICGKKGREYGAKYRKQERVIQYHREYARRNALKVKLSKYQLTLAEWESLLEECDSKCSICGIELPTISEQFVDHDHSCCGPRKSCGNCVRAILCHRCNLGIAAFRDRPELLRNGADYLERHAG